MRTIEQQLVQIMKDFQNRKVSGSCQRSKRDRITSENGNVSLHLWGTKIVQFNGENITLFSGGYRTTTTKSRLNAVLRGLGCNWRIYQKNFAWYASHPSGLQDVEFVEGLTFNL
jgi:hypothetical protein